jgi:Fe-S oxidoreductase
MWTEETLGRRIINCGAEQILASARPAVATACPFCLTRLRDALNDHESPKSRSASCQILADRRGCRRLDLLDDELRGRPREFEAHGADLVAADLPRDHPPVVQRQGTAP